MWSLLVIVPMMPSAGHAADAIKSTTHRITPADGAIELDGVLDEPAWRSAWVTELPFERQDDFVTGFVRGFAPLDH